MVYLVKVYKFRNVTSNNKSVLCKIKQIYSSITFIYSKYAEIAALVYEI
jgi:hypothetical protein